MKTNGSERSGCSKPVIIFLSMAVIIVAAFLIVALVKTCEANHEDTEQVELGGIGEFTHSQIEFNIV